MFAQEQFKHAGPPLFPSVRRLTIETESPGETYVRYNRDTGYATKMPNPLIDLTEDGYVYEVAGKRRVILPDPMY